MTPLGFKFLTWMIITVPTCSGVLQTLHDEVLDYLGFLWQYTVMGKSKCTDPNTHLEFCWNSHACKGVPWVLWLILKSHHTVVPLLQLQGRCYTLRVFRMTASESARHPLKGVGLHSPHESILWHCPDTKRHMHSHAILGTKIKKEQGFLPTPRYMT